jgi:hypothetical protein
MTVNLSAREQKYVDRAETLYRAILSDRKMNMNEKAGVLSLASAAFLGSAAAAFNNISEQKTGTVFDFNEMVRTTAKVIVDIALASDTQ